MKICKIKDDFNDNSFLIQTNSYPVGNIKEFVHKHEYFEFFLIVNGQIKHSINNKEQVLKKGDIVMLCPDYSHSFKFVGFNTATLMQVIFLPSVLGNLDFFQENKKLSELIFMVPFYIKESVVFKLSVKTFLKIRELMEEMITEQLERNKGYQIAIKAKLIDLLITIARIYEMEKKDHENIPKTISGTTAAVLGSLDFIKKHFLEDLSLSDIAQQRAGISKEYFSTIFHNITGTTFIKYITDLRIQRAKKLLLSTDDKISSICLDSGFHDLSHFNRTFKNFTGKTPSQFRND